MYGFFHYREEWIGVLEDCGRGRIDKEFARRETPFELCCAICPHVEHAREYLTARRKSKMHSIERICRGTLRGMFDILRCIRLLDG